MKKVNLEAEVLEIQKPQLIHTRYGNSIVLTNVWIADETGKVKLCLWGEQANSPSVGDMVQINHASVRTFRGERLLTLGKLGSLSILRALIVDNGNVTA
jgi:replication factor A1